MVKSSPIKDCLDALLLLSPCAQADKPNVWLPSRVVAQFVTKMLPSLDINSLTLLPINRVKPVNGGSVESKITQFIAKLCETKHADSQYCDVTSSKIHMVSMPVPIDRFRELECIASEYNRDLPCLASDILTLALEEVIEHIPPDEKIRLDKIRHDREIEDAERHKKECMFNAGGT